MSLLDKLAGDQEPKLPVHQFYAALAEFAAGAVTRQNVVDYFQLDSADEVELDFLIAEYQATDPTRQQEFLEFIHRIFMLAEVKVPGYDSNAALSTRISNF